MPQLRLSEEQLTAVDSDAGAIVVAAGAGSGKTEVISHRIERILAETPNDEFRVAALSYTVKAAQELQKRLAARLGGLHRRADTDTIHGFALLLLRRFGTRIGLPAEPEILTQNEDRAELLQQWLHDSGLPDIDNPSIVFQELDLARSRGKHAPLLDEWRAALATRGALDFPGVLEKASELLESSWVAKNLRRTYRHLVVDEAQNLTPAQYSFLRCVIGPPGDQHLSVMLLGDTRQSLVGFAGADPTLMGRFTIEYSAESFQLHTNYRSARKIIATCSKVAEALGSPSVPMGDVRYPAEGAVEVRVARSESDEAKLVQVWIQRLLDNGLDPSVLAPGESPKVDPSDIAVLGRTAASLRLVREQLTNSGIEWAEGSVEDEWVASEAAKTALDLIAFHSAPDHRSTRRRILQAVGLDSGNWSDVAWTLLQASDLNIRKLARLGTASNPAEFVSMMTDLDIEDDDWSTDTNQIVDSWNSFIDSVGGTSRTFGNLRQYIFRLQRGNDLADGVRVLTVHKSQGREFKAVILVACNDGQFPDFRASTPDQSEGELRAFY